MKGMGYKTMYHKKSIKPVRTAKTTRCMNKPGRRVFGEKADEYMNDYARRLAFRPRG